MIIDQLTLIVGIIVILLAIVASLASPFLRRIKIYESDNNENDNNDNAIPVSIIIPVHDEATDLKRNLPAFLNQDYKGDFKIIVIADKNDRETEDLMNRLMPENNIILRISCFMAYCWMIVSTGVVETSLSPFSKVTVSSNWAFVFSTLSAKTKTIVQSLS